MVGSICIVGFVTEAQVTCTEGTSELGLKLQQLAPVRAELVVGNSMLSSLRSDPRLAPVLRVSLGPSPAACICSLRALGAILLPTLSWSMLKARLPVSVGQV